MRASFLILVATLGSLPCATSVGAYALNMTARGATNALATSDTVTVDVFLDADAGITLLGVGVIASNDAVLDYDVSASLAAPRAGSAGPGAQPSYLLYVGGKITTLLYPQQTPAFLNWPSPAPGTEQVNLTYAEAALRSTLATGVDLWIGTLVFHVSGPITSETLSLSLTLPTLGIQNGSDIVPPGTVPLSDPIVLTGVPEPTSATLIALGVLVLCIAGRSYAASWKMTPNA